MSEEHTDVNEAAGTPDQVVPASASGTPRLLGLDFTRGIAVLGILAANIVAFGQPFNAYMWPEQFLTPHGEVSNWMWVVQFVIIDSKMRGLFTLLFGAGLVLFMEKAWAKGATRWLQARRLFWLMLFGLFHFFLIWRGDILFLYSISGFVALAFLKMKAKSLLITGGLGYLAGAILFGTSLGFTYAVADTPFGETTEMADTREGMMEAIPEIKADDAAEAEILMDGTYGEYVSHVATEHWSDPLINLFMFLFETLPLMLIGMGLFKTGFFSGDLNPTKQRNWGLVGIVVGTALTLPIALMIKAGGFTYYGTLFAFIGASMLPRLPVILGLAALLALWGPSATGWLGQRFIAAGRMAFTNYLGTSVMMMLVFHPWAGGLWGDLTRPQLFGVVLAAWVVMLAWSKPWLDHFRYGPLEWLWRCLTYGRLFPLKK